MADVINKEVIKDAISDALDEILEVKEKIESSDDIISDVEDISNQKKDGDEVSETVDDIVTLDNSDENNTDISVDDVKMNDDNIVEGISDTLSDTVDGTQHYDFFGVSIDAEPDGDKWKITIKGNSEFGNRVQEETVDTLELPTIFGMIEDYFNNSATDNLSGKVLDQDSEVDESNLDDNEDMVEEENEDDIVDENDNVSNASLASLRYNNNKEITKIFELGLLAKDTALNLAKDKILASSIKECIDKDKKTNIKLKKINDKLKIECANYVTACKKCECYKKAIGIISGRLVNIRDNLKNNKLSKKEALIATKICRNTIDKLLVNNSLDGILASMQYFKKMTKKSVLIASKQKRQYQTKLQNVKLQKTLMASNLQKRRINKRRKPVLANKNVYNRNGIVSNINLRHNSVTSEIDNLIKDITRLGESE